MIDENEKNVKDMSVDELKVLAFDLQQHIQFKQQQLKQLYGELSERINNNNDD